MNFQEKLFYLLVEGRKGYLRDQNAGFYHLSKNYMDKNPSPRKRVKPIKAKHYITVKMPYDLIPKRFPSVYNPRFKNSDIMQHDIQFGKQRKVKRKSTIQKMDQEDRQQDLFNRSMKTNRMKTINNIKSTYKRKYRSRGRKYI